MYEFNGIIWPKGKYGVYVDIMDFDMSDDEKIETRNAKPKGIDTREDSKFTAKFIVPSNKREPDAVYLHIFGVRFN